MTTYSEDSKSLKGLSFIDWDSLGQDEFVKLEKIINDSKDSPGVQLPFVPPAPKPSKSQANSAVDVEASVLHPSAPVFQPAMAPPPPPSIMGYPIPVPAWTHGDPNMQSSAPGYPIPMHGGYVFQDPSLAANGEVTVAFVTTLSNGQPMYAFAGHQMPPNFQPTPPISHHHHGDRVMNSGMPHSGRMPQQRDLMAMQPVSVPGGTMMTPSPAHVQHPLLMGGHGTSNMAGPGHRPLMAQVNMQQPPAAHHHHHHPHHPQTTPMMYMTQLPPTEPSQVAIIDSAPQMPRQLPEVAANTATAATTPLVSKAISGLPPRQETPVVEFAGPVVFDVPAAPPTTGSGKGPDKTEELEKPSKECNSFQQEDSKQLVSNNAGVAKVSSVKEVVIDVKCDSDDTTVRQPDPSPSTSKSSLRKDKEDSQAMPDCHSSTSPASAKSPVSPYHNGVNNTNSNFSDTDDYPKITNSEAPLSPPTMLEKDKSTTTSPISPSALPDKDIQHTKDTPLKENAVPPAPKMWSSLFGNKTGSAKSNNSSSPTSQALSLQNFPTISTTNTEESLVPNKVEPKSVSYWQEQERVAANSTVLYEKVKPVVAKQDPLAPRLLEKLSNFPISHIPIVIQPRGLKNGKNTCFMNATLQVLMGCPPFVHLFRAFKSFPARTGGRSSTPIFDSLVLFVNSFQNGQRAKQNSRGKKGGALDISLGLPFSPDSLLSVAQDILGFNIGVQQDAEEFLGQILSICHEELENIIKMNKNMDSVNNNSDTKPVEANGHVDNFNHVEGFDDDDEEDDSWQRVGPKNHSVETNVNDCGQTPLSSIFAGLSRSCLQRESGKSSDTLDSFFTLKLDIQAESVHSVKEALVRLNTMETVHDADGRKVHGQRRMFFDVLPPVLIMHLKLFEYSNGNGQKIQKKISFDVDLQIPKEIISRVGRTKYSSPKSRAYKLFGVVNHHGVRMNNGHYTSDVYLPVVNGWLHFDDSDVTATNEAQVLQYCERSMPYMLFYRRLDANQ